MTFHWPQIIMIVLYGFTLGISLKNHGKPRSNDNVFISMLATAISVFILWKGGFWG